MKAMVGRKSLAGSEKQESVCGAGDQGVLLLSNEGLSRHWRNLRGRSQPRGATHHGNSLDRGGPSRETKTLQSSRNLPNSCASLDLSNDRPGDGAAVPAPSEPTSA